MIDERVNRNVNVPTWLPGSHPLKPKGGARRRCRPDVVDILSATLGGNICEQRQTSRSHLANSNLDEANFSLVYDHTGPKSADDGQTGNMCVKEVKLNI